MGHPTLADAIHFLQLCFAKRLRSRKRATESSSFWQKRYYDRNVRDAEEFTVEPRSGRRLVRNSGRKDQQQNGCSFSPTAEPAVATTNSIAKPGASWPHKLRMRRSSPLASPLIRKTGARPARIPQSTVPLIRPGARASHPFLDDTPDSGAPVLIDMCYTCKAPCPSGVYGTLPLTSRPEAP